jgi:hypothetical protein
VCVCVFKRSTLHGSLQHVSTSLFIAWNVILMPMSHSQQYSPVLLPIKQWCHVLRVKRKRKLHEQKTAGRTNLQLWSAVRKCQNLSRLLVLKYRVTNHEISSRFNQYEVLHLAYRRIIFERNVIYTTRATIVPFTPDTSSFSTQKFPLGGVFNVSACSDFSVIVL